MSSVLESCCSHLRELPGTFRRCPGVGRRLCCSRVMGPSERLPASWADSSLTGHYLPGVFLLTPPTVKKTEVRFHLTSSTPFHLNATVLLRQQWAFSEPCVLWGLSRSDNTSDLPPLGPGGLGVDTDSRHCCGQQLFLGNTVTGKCSVIWGCPECAEKNTRPAG